MCVLELGGKSKDRFIAFHSFKKIYVIYKLYTNRHSGAGAAIGRPRLDLTVRHVIGLD